MGFLDRGGGAMTYPPGGSLVTQIESERERRLAGYNARSIPLVYPGQDVLADQPVIRLELYENQVEGQGQPRTPVVIPSGLRGQVVKTTARGGVVIKTRAALLTGNIGAGQQVAGLLSVWQAARSRPSPVPAGAILVIPGPAAFGMLRHAIASRGGGIVSRRIQKRA